MFTTKAPRLAAVAILLGSFAAGMPAFADDAAAPANSPQVTPVDAATPKPMPPKPMGMHKPHETPAEMQQHVEERIKTLHAKLMITPAEEDSWGKVAQAMRDSESATTALIHERHQAVENYTAVEDLQSYQKIAQAHADGLGKVAAAFSDLYNSMSDEQKANADKVFGGFEGHDHGKHAMKKTVTQ